MYGKGAGSLATSTGVALLPATGQNRGLFVLAASLVVVGIAVFIASTVLARKSNSAA